MKTTTLLVAAALVASFATTALAADDHDGQWRRNHPRRAEVNGRLHHQDKRIHEEVREGDMSKAQAADLHHEDHQIRHEERAMASQNGGHITRQEKKTLNRQENQVSGQIGH